MESNPSQQANVGKSPVDLFKRSTYIAHLFNSQDVIDRFNYIHFESLSTLLKVVKENLMNVLSKHVIELNITSLTEFNQLLEIMDMTEITKYNYFRVVINKELLFQIVPKYLRTAARFELIIDTNNVFDFDMTDLFKTTNCVWIENNIVSYRIHLNYSNYQEICNRIAYLYNKSNFRFLDLIFDYESFNSITLLELSKLEFWLNHINIWVNFTGEFRGFQLTLMNIKNILKKIYVTNDLKIYLTQKHKEERPEDYLVDLNKTKDKNGEDISYLELNKLRQYIDLTPLVLISPIENIPINGFLIDFYQNKKIMGNICERPLIEVLICNWLLLNNERRECKIDK